MLTLYPPFDEELSAPDEVPVFPLPQTVLLPGEPLPLHVHEERYKVLAKEALSGERLIVMGHLKPAEQEPDGSEIYRVAGLGRIVMDEPLEEGKFNLLVLGAKRIRIAKILQERPYQRAQIEVLPDRFSQTASSVLSALEDELLDLAQEFLTPERTADLPFENPAMLLDHLLHGNLPLGALTDLVATVVPLNPMEKQMILEETDVILRSEKMIFCLKFRLRSGQLPPFPQTLH